MKINIPNHMTDIKITVTYMRDGDVCERDISLTATDKSKAILLENAIKVVITATVPEPQEACHTRPSYQARTESPPE